jgi:hypothetical protein
VHAVPGFDGAESRPETLDKWQKSRKTRNKDRRRRKAGLKAAQAVMDPNNAECIQSSMCETARAGQLIATQNMLVSPR